MKLRTLLELGRISNLPTVWSNMTAGWLLGGGGATTGLLWTLVGGSLLYLAGMAMNDACDAAWDRQHKGDRPIVRGLISRNSVWILTTIYGAGGAVATIYGGKSCPAFVAGLIATLSLYNVFHKRWAGATWLMGACRTFLYLIAASGATGGRLPPAPSIIWGAALGVYVVGLTYVARGESKNAPLIRWPLLLLAAPLLCSIGYVIAGWPAHSLVFAAVFAGWLLFSLSVMRGGGAQIGKSVGFFLAGMVLIDALAVSAGWPYLSFVLIGTAPLLILFQRFISAT